jgi:hypothetical protein
MLLAIDPGIDQGWSLWNDSTRRLLNCGLGNVPSAHRPEATVIECPQIYGSSTSKADPADIIKLAVRVGILVERARESKTYLVAPRAWAGQVPKPIRHARLINALDPESWQVVLDVAKRTKSAKMHNVLDAIGIGLWFCDLGPSVRELYRVDYHK